MRRARSTAQPGARRPSPGRRALRTLGLGIAVALAPAAQGIAGDAEAGRALSGPCTTCHGANGISAVPNAPHLAGQPELYLVEQLRAYRSGKRPHEVMRVIAKPLTDDQIDDLAAWYASFVIEVKAQ
ncbi:MAG: cytochrome c [Lautropia sp.]